MSCPQDAGRGDVHVAPSSKTGGVDAAAPNKAGCVAGLRAVPGVTRYVMVFHGTGPEPEPIKFQTHACIGIAWSDDLKTWKWPEGK